MIRAFESQIGLEIFVRAGNRLTGLTQSGHEAIALARRVLRDVSTISELSRDKATDVSGTLRVGTTYIHARYTLVPVVKRFFNAYPGVNLVLNQGTPQQILNWVVEGAIDIGLSTLPVQSPSGVTTLDAYQVERCLIVPLQHPLLKSRLLKIEQIARYPLVTFDESFSSGWVVQREFQRRGLTPRISMRATDTNVIKAYVAAGMGVAVVPKLAVDPSKDVDIRIISSDHIFPASMAMISLRSDHLLRTFGYDFIQMSRSMMDAKGHIGSCRAIKC
ncbi:LysR substrate-binding domain-containing protein [Polaromonas sp. P1(28)-13]|nr:LysR substrate-binding domain-containing protein [Polaromonas sp. P1(28)-13]